MSDRQTEIAALLAPTVASLQLELLGVVFAQSGADALLRLYIDVPYVDAPGRTVTIEDCEAVSREVSAVMDVNDPIASHYTLEVSSPGIDRPLFTVAHFARHVGESVKINLQIPMNGRRRMQGVIVAVEGEDILLRVDGAELRLQHANIEKARLVPDWAALGLASGSHKGGTGKGSPEKEKAPREKGRGRKSGQSSKSNGADRPPVTEHEQ